MCLQAVLHLQAVFERAQEDVRVGEFRALALGDEAAVGEPAETDERVRRVKPRIARAVREL